MLTSASHPLPHHTKPAAELGKGQALFQTFEKVTETHVLGDPAAAAPWLGGPKASVPQPRPAAISVRASGSRAGEAQPHQDQLWEVLWGQVVPFDPTQHPEAGTILVTGPVKQMSGSAQSKGVAEPCSGPWWPCAHHTLALRGTLGPVSDGEPREQLYAGSRDVCTQTSLLLPYTWGEFLGKKQLSALCPSWWYSKCSGKSC